MTCVHTQIESALDRWSENHWFIHQMEMHYHDPEPLRYSLNAFIRSIKEVPQIIKMELQNHGSYQSEIKPVTGELASSNLFKALRENRDFIVHRGMLEILSTGMVGTTEGCGFKIGVGFPVPPHESSDDAYQRYLEHCKADKVFRGTWGPDCDSSPCISREWKLPAFEGAEILSVAVEAWQLVGSVLSRIVEVLGGEPLNLELPCLHDPSRVQMKVYSQSKFFEIVGGEVVA